MPNVKAFGGTYKQRTDKSSKMIEADLADAVASLPDLSSLQGNRNTATRTDGKAADMLKAGSKESTPKLIPKSTPTAFPACNRLATEVISSTANSQKAEKHKLLQGRKLDSNKEALSPTGTDGKKLRLGGQLSNRDFDASSRPGVSNSGITAVPA